jgi:hypothetical protein
MATTFDLAEWFVGETVVIATLHATVPDGGKGLQKVTYSLSSPGAAAVQISAEDATILIAAKAASRR